MKLKFYRSPKIWVAVTASFFFLMAANGGASEAKSPRPKPKISQWRPRLPLYSAWALPPHSLEKPSLLLTPRERENSVIERVGPLRSVGVVGRSPASASSHITLDSIYGYQSEPTH